jgi:predicted nuclease with TOPRIM domain
MENEFVEKFRVLLRDEISELESKKSNLEKKIEKLTNKFDINDIQKLDKLSNDISNINHTIIHLYAMIGSDLKKKLELK